MVDEKKIIARFRKVVNEFIEKHPDKANGLEVKVINTFIELLQEETRDTDILNKYESVDWFTTQAEAEQKLKELRGE